MKKEFRDQWMDALRSGQYQKARGAMYKDGAVCALGVLCETLGVERIDKEGPNSFYHYQGEYAAARLPEKLAEDVGLSRDDQIRVAFWNDEMNLSFRKIAELVFAEISEETEVCSVDQKIPKEKR